jgi:hypothetical protein
VTGAHDIDVVCVETDRTWTCAVRVRDARSTSEHEVVVDEIDLPAALDGATTPDVERLVGLTFGFLLEREPKESILRRFELPVVARYFPEYVHEIDRRLAAER